MMPEDETFFLGKILQIMMKSEDNRCVEVKNCVSTRNMSSLLLDLIECRSQSAKVLLVLPGKFARQDYSNYTNPKTLKM